MGPIPPEIGNLANLTRLWAQATGLSGSIPPELGKLANLQDLLLGYGNNTLTGRIPPGLGNLANLERLDLWSNSLTGPIPPELGNLESLVSLQLYGNNLTGPIPPRTRQPRQSGKPVAELQRPERPDPTGARETPYAEARAPRPQRPNRFSPPCIGQLDDRGRAAPRLQRTWRVRCRPSSAECRAFGSCPSPTTRPCPGRFPVT